MLAYFKKFRTQILHLYETFFHTMNRIRQKKIIHKSSSWFKLLCKLPRHKKLKGEAKWTGSEHHNTRYKELSIV